MLYVWHVQDKQCEIPDMTLRQLSNIFQKASLNKEKHNKSLRLFKKNYATKTEGALPVQLLILKKQLHSCSSMFSHETTSFSQEETSDLIWAAFIPFYSCIFSEQRPQTALNQHMKCFVWMCSYTQNK